MVNDVSRAYMYALCDEDVNVELCDEDGEEGKEQIGKLSKAMWDPKRRKCCNVSRKYSQRRWIHGRSNVSVPISPSRSWHDCVFAWWRLCFLRIRGKRKYSIQTSTIGEGEKLAKEVRILNRIVRGGRRGVTIEADPWHLEILVDNWWKTKAAHHQRKQGRPGEEAGRDLPRGRSGRQFGIEVQIGCRTLELLAADRPDIAFSVKGSRGVWASRRHWCWAFRRLVISEVSTRAVAWYRYQEHSGCLQAYTDVIGQGAAKRESQPPGDALVRIPLFETWSKTQATRALSSAVHLSGLQHDRQGMRFVWRKGSIGHRQERGCGKARHIDTGLLWIQEKNESKELRQGTRRSQPRRHVHQSSCEWRHQKAHEHHGFRVRRRERRHCDLDQRAGCRGSRRCWKIAGECEITTLSFEREDIQMGWLQQWRRTMSVFLLVKHMEKKCRRQRRSRLRLAEGECESMAPGGVKHAFGDVWLSLAMCKWVKTGSCLRRAMRESPSPQVMTRKQLRPKWAYRQSYRQKWQWDPRLGSRHKFCACPEKRLAVFFSFSCVSLLSFFLAFLFIFCSLSF